MADFQKAGKADAPKNPEFNPQARYVWEKDDKFLLTGEEFETILHALRAHLANPEFMKMAQVWEGIKTTDKIVRDGVEAGVIRLAPPEPVPLPTPQVKDDPFGCG